MNQADLIESYFALQQKAVDALLDLFQHLDFNDPDMAINVKVLGELCQHMEATVLGTALVAAEHAKKGNLEYLNIVEQQIEFGMSAHKFAEKPCLKLGGLMHLRPVLDAIKFAANSILSTNLSVKKASVKSVVLVISNLDRGAATSLVASKLIHSLHSLGLDSHLLITGHGSHANEDTCEMESVGIKILRINQSSIYARAQDVVRNAVSLKADAVIFYTWPTDIAAQIASCKRLSWRQLFINHTCDQKVGDFDVRICYTKATSLLTDSQRCFYVPPVRVREEKLEDVSEAPLSTWGLNESNIIIGNYSRLSKCVDKAFMEAMVRILKDNVSAVLMLPGLPDPNSEQLLRDWFDFHGLANQVRFPGFLIETYLPLIKATHVYCDTFIWTGGQSVLDAMAMGVPVVSSKAEFGGTFLDPTGVSPATLGSELLPDSALVAQSNSVDEYVSIVQRLIDDSKFHQIHSKRNILRAEELSWQQYPRILIEQLNKIPVSKKIC